MSLVPVVWTAQILTKVSELSEVQHKSRPNFCGPREIRTKSRPKQFVIPLYLIAPSTESRQLRKYDLS